MWSEESCRSWIVGSFGGGVENVENKFRLQLIKYDTLDINKSTEYVKKIRMKKKANSQATFVGEIAKLKGIY